MRAKRILFRQTDGRFREPSLERDFGLRTAVCPACGSFNPYGRKQPVEVNGFIDPASFNQWERPAKCSGCGVDLPAE